MVERHDIAQYLNANMLCAEHRYFGDSQPNDLSNTNFTYLYADQAAADLHHLVTVMKQDVFNKGNKWVSTGTSKCGINTPLYACYSDKNGWNDIDLYMPFGAPFLTGTTQSAGDKLKGTYVKDVCGSGYPANSNVSKILSIHGFHNNHFLNPKIYTPEASTAIKQALDKHIFGK